jgi:hypothetical protein
MPGQVTPYPLSMILCDGLWRDPYNGKFTLIGLFSTVGSENFPMALAVLYIYIALTDGQGTMPVKLELVDVDEERPPIFSDENDMQFADPCAVTEMAFQRAGVIFPQPGEYRLKLFVNNEFIIERRILVTGPQPVGEPQ